MKYIPSSIIVVVAICLSSGVLAAPITITRNLPYLLGGLTSGPAATSSITDLPILDPALGTLASVSTSGFFKFSLLNPTYSIGYEPGPGALGNAQYNIALRTGSYIKGASDNVGFVNYGTITCPASAAAHCSSGTISFPNLLTSYNFGKRSGVAISGGNIPVSATGSYVGVGNFSGAYSFSGQITATIAYNPFTAKEYIREAVAFARANQDPGISNYDTANLAISYIDNLRESSPETSGQNEQLRNAEYALRGYAGAYGSKAGNLVSGSSYKDFVNNIFNVGGPYALPYYNAWKAFKQHNGSDINPSGLPATPPGGLGANLEGAAFGAKGRSLEDLANNYSNTNQKDSPTPTASVDLSAPTLPDYKGVISIGPDNYTVASFSFTPLAAQTSFFDPLTSTVLAYAAYGNSISDIILPPQSGITEPIGLQIGDKTFSLVPGQLLDLSLLGFKDGIDTLLLLGLPLGIPDFTIGFRFVDAAPTLLFQFAQTEKSIPEPASWMLMGGLLTVFGLLVLRQRNSAAGRA